MTVTNLVQPAAGRIVETGSCVATETGLQHIGTPGLRYGSITLNSTNGAAVHPRPDCLAADVFLLGPADTITMPHVSEVWVRALTADERTMPVYLDDAPVHLVDAPVHLDPAAAAGGTSTISYVLVGPR